MLNIPLIIFITGIIFLGDYLVQYSKKKVLKVIPIILLALMIKIILLGPAIIETPPNSFYYLQSSLPLSVGLYGLLNIPYVIYLFIKKDGRKRQVLAKIILFLSVSFILILLTQFVLCCI